MMYDLGLGASEVSGTASRKSVRGGQERLVQAGFDERAATELARKFPLDQILRQVEAFAKRTAISNPLGLLRRAIEEDWSSPTPKPAEMKVSHPARIPFVASVSELIDPAYVAFVDDEAARVAGERP